MEIWRLKAWKIRKTPKKDVLTTWTIYGTRREGRILEDMYGGEGILAEQGYLDLTTWELECSRREKWISRNYINSLPLRIKGTLDGLERFLNTKFRREKDLEAGSNTKEERVHKLVHSLVHFNMFWIIEFVCLAVNMSN